MLVPLFACSVATAGAPEGWLDVASPGQVSGWARDPDFAGPIAVHVYLDGTIVHGMEAHDLRPDLPWADQEHGYNWSPLAWGPGTHSLTVYAIGVDASGNLDGENIALSGTPYTVNGDCSGFAAPASYWCEGNPAYYVGRQGDSRYLLNDNVRAGLNVSYGGTLFELYGSDHAFNYIAEHGGGAVQASLWGYEEKGGVAWFGHDLEVCDPTPYASEAECQAGGNATCYPWANSQGAHVVDCNARRSCLDWGAGAPFNPILAQAQGCGWDSPTNDVLAWEATSAAVSTTYENAWHFTKDEPFTGLSVRHMLELGTAWASIDWRITYDGPYTLGTHPQEMPAIFPSWGLANAYYYADVAVPWESADGAVASVVNPVDWVIFGVGGAPEGPHGPPTVVAQEPWVSVCNAGESRCLTVMVCSAELREFNAAPTSYGYGYLTAIGGFAIVPGLDIDGTTYLFPYRYDAVVGGKTVREWMREIAYDRGLWTDADADGVPDATVTSDGTPDDARELGDSGLVVHAEEGVPRSLEAEASASAGSCSGGGGSAAGGVAGLAALFAGRRRGVVFVLSAAGRLT